MAGDIDPVNGCCWTCGRDLSDGELAWGHCVLCDGIGGDDTEDVAEDELDLDFARTAPNEGRRCRGCGCTETNACVTESGPCHWIAPDRCSACADAS